MSKSSTLWSPGDTVKDAAETVGISNLPDDVAKVLAMDIEYRLHEVIEQATKFMRHSKRTVLTTADITSALRVLNVEPLYGYETGRAVQFHEAVVGAGNTLFYLDDDEEVDFDKLINEPLPKVPREPSYTAHWLAVEGVQPAIPQNPHPGEVKAIPPAIRGAQQSFATPHFGKDVDIKMLVKHMVSKELQLYFDRVVHVLLDTSTSEQAQTDRQTALFSLRNDPGLHQLTPYFVQFVQEKISTNLVSNTRIVGTMLDVLDALLANPTIFVEPYIHQIVPSVLTVLVARHLTPSVDDPEDEDAYELRVFAAALLRKLTRQFGDSYPALRPRLTRTLLKGFMDVERPLASLTGIVLGISSLGSEVVQIIIVGNLGPWFEAVSSRSPVEDWNRLQGVLADALKSIDKVDHPPDLPSPVTDWLKANDISL